MNEEEIRSRVMKTLCGIVPELEPGTLKMGASLREQLDIDSMDFLNFLIALQQEFGVDVPEADAGKLASVDSCVAYLGEALRRQLTA